MNLFPDILTDYMHEHAEEGWAKLGFELAFSQYVTFLYTFGAGLRKSKWPLLNSFGDALAKSAVMLVILFRREQGAFVKGMSVALPGEEADEELNTKLQVITRS